MVQYTVLFDLDGTLVDTAPDIAGALNRLRHQHGLTPLDYPAIRDCVSLGTKALVRLGLGDELSDEAFSQACKNFIADYQENIAVESGLFPGMGALLDQIEAKGWRWGVVTNKAGALAEKVLHDLELSHRCSSLIAGDSCKERKPHPLPIFAALEQAYGEPAHAVYIGDDKRDIDAGRAANTATIAVTFGYIAPGDDIQLWGADVILDRACDIWPWLEKHAQIKAPMPA